MATSVFLPLGDTRSAPQSGLRKPYGRVGRVSGLMNRGFGGGPAWCCAGWSGRPGSVVLWGFLGGGPQSAVLTEVAPSVLYSVAETREH